MGNLIDRITARVEKDLSFRTLIKLILGLTVILLFLWTGSFWEWLFYTAHKIIQPFFIGFVIAYVLRPIIKKGEEHNISRKWTIPLLYIVVIVFLGWLTFTIIPLIFSRLSEFITSMIKGVNSFYGAYADMSLHDVPNWVTEFLKQMVDALNNMKSIASDMGTRIPSVLQDTAKNFTIGIFIFIISIYMCAGWEKIANGIRRFASRFGSKSEAYLSAIDDEIGTYIRSLIMLMIIKFGEYALLYYLVGHKDWLIIALLTSIGLIVPYIGATIANIIGILTALTLPVKNIVILLIMIVILSNVDAYAISPMVHAHNAKMSPLWALFAIFAGGILAGAAGIIFAIPVYLAIRVAVNMKEEEKLEEKANA